MAIPPIISNNPILKLFKADRSASGAQGPEAARSENPQDIVDISEAAQAKLEGIRQFTSEHLDDVQDTAVQTRDILSETEVSLGLDPHFQE